MNKLNKRFSDIYYSQWNSTENKVSEWTIFIMAAPQPQPPPVAPAAVVPGGAVLMNLQRIWQIINEIQQEEIRNSQQSTEARDERRTGTEVAIIASCNGSTDASVRTWVIPLDIAFAMYPHDAMEITERTARDL